MSEQQINKLNQQVIKFQQQGKYEQAMTIAKQANSLAQQFVGKNHPLFADTVNSIAELLHNMGSYDKARRLHSMAWQIRRDSLGDNHPDTARSLNNLGMAFQAEGNFNQAMKNYQEALQIVRGDNSLDTARIMNNLAELYYEMGDYVQARLFYEPALKIRQAALGETDPEMAQTQGGLAKLFQATGRYTEAETLYQQALKIKRVALNKKLPDIAQTIQGLAELYRTIGKYDKAVPLFKEVLEIRRTVLGESHLETAATLDGLGQLYYLMNRYDEAEPLYRQAMKIRQKALGETDPDFAQTVGNLAQLLYARADYEQSNRLYVWALDIRHEALGEIHPDVSENLIELGKLNAVMGKADNALKHIKQAAKIDSQMIGQLFSIGSENQRMAYLKIFYTHLTYFLSLTIEQCATVSEATQAGIDIILQRKALGAEALAVQRDALLGGHYPELATELQKLTALRQQIAQKMLAGAGIEEFQTYKRVLTDLRDEKERLETELTRRIPEMNLAQKMGLVNRQAVSEVMQPGTVLIEFTRFNLFDFKATAQEKQWQSAHYLAFVLHAGQPNNARIFNLGEAQKIERLIANVRESITGQEEKRGLYFDDDDATVADNETPDMKAGAELRATLFDPLLSALGESRRLFISPDGDLSRLPFEILPTANGGRLIDDYHISYLSAGRDILRMGAEFSGQPNSALVIANPDFDLTSADNDNISEKRQLSQDISRAGFPFKPLPDTEIEGLEIAKLLGVSPLMDKEALEGRLKAHPSPHILHIATHGFFIDDQKLLPDGRLQQLTNLENPLLRSGLALAGANSWNKGLPLPPEAEDAILTAEDVSGLNLTATSMVVLSACETGLGEAEIGEGVFGLRRAFILAGAKTLIMSLWNVPDRQTRMLMNDFYCRILAGADRSAALREAQLMIKERYPDPYYWGAFICQGEPGRL